MVPMCFYSQKKALKHRDADKQYVALVLERCPEDMSWKVIAYATAVTQSKQRSY
jgi:hypothetical protein